MGEFIRNYVGFILLFRNSYVIFYRVCLLQLVEKIKTYETNSSDSTEVIYCIYVNLWYIILFQVHNENTFSYTNSLVFHHNCFLFWILGFFIWIENIDMLLFLKFQVYFHYIKILHAKLTFWNPLLSKIYFWLTKLQAIPVNLITSI